MDYLIDALLILGKSQFIIVLFIISIGIFEYATGSVLFVRATLAKKNPKVARLGAEFNSIIYALLNIGLYIYYTIIREPAFHWLTLLFWLGGLGLLSLLFYMMNYMFQGIDPDKAEDDYT